MVLRFMETAPAGLRTSRTLARIIYGVILIEEQSFRREGIPFGIANTKSQIPTIKSGICDLESEIPSASEESLLQGRASIRTVC
jgi:hypothetical protein